MPACACAETWADAVPLVRQARTGGLASSQNPRKKGFLQHLCAAQREDCLRLCVPLMCAFLCIQRVSLGLRRCSAFVGYLRSLLHPFPRTAVLQPSAVAASPRRIRINSLLYRFPVTLGALQRRPKRHHVSDERLAAPGRRAGKPRSTHYFSVPCLSYFCQGHNHPPSRKLSVRSVCWTPLELSKETRWARCLTPIVAARFISWSAGQPLSGSLSWFACVIQEAL